MCRRLLSVRTLGTKRTKLLTTANMERLKERVRNESQEWTKPEVDEKGDIEEYQYISVAIMTRRFGRRKVVGMHMWILGQPLKSCLLL